jgi:hypothetical protein
MTARLDKTGNLRGGAQFGRPRILGNASGTWWHHRRTHDGSSLV